MEIEKKETSDDIKIEPESVLGIVTKVNRISRLLAKPSDRDNISLSNIKNALSIYNMVLATIVKMSNVEKELILDNLKENLEVLLIELRLLVERNLEEYDSQSISKVVSTFRTVKSNIYWIIGRWFTRHDLGGTTNGDYDGILNEVILSCISINEFLGV